MVVIFNTNRNVNPYSCQTGNKSTSTVPNHPTGFITAWNVFSCLIIPVNCFGLIIQISCSHLFGKSVRLNSSSTFSTFTFFLPLSHLWLSLAENKDKNNFRSCKAMLENQSSEHFWTLLPPVHRGVAAMLYIIHKANEILLEESWVCRDFKYSPMCFKGLREKRQCWISGWNCYCVFATLIIFEAEVGREWSNRQINAWSLTMAMHSLIFLDLPIRFLSFFGLWTVTWILYLM